MKRPRPSGICRFYKIGVLIVFLLTFYSKTDAQKRDTEILSLKFREFKSNWGDFSGRYRWRFFVPPNSYETYPCRKENNGRSDQRFYYNDELAKNVRATLDSQFEIGVESWIENSSFDCGGHGNCGTGDCDFNSGCRCGPDKWLREKNFGDAKIILVNYEPAVENRIAITYAYDRLYQIVYSFNYRPTPSLISGVSVGKANHPYDEGALCADSIIHLSVSSVLPSQWHAGLKYTWYYSVASDTYSDSTWVPNPNYCDEDQMQICFDTNPEGPDYPSCCKETSPGTWKHYTSTPTYSLPSTSGSINNGTLDVNLLSLPSVANLKKKSSITFFVYTSYKGLSALSPENKTIQLSPRAPKPTLITSFESCPNSPTGRIEVTDIKGNGMYQYILRLGHGNKSPCKDDCFDALSSGDILGTSTVIENVPHNYHDKSSPQNIKGEYTLWITNFSGEYGVCASSTDVTIPVISELQIGLTEAKKDATCNGFSDGEIKLNHVGGKEPFTFSLTSRPDNTTGIFSGLKSATYIAKVIDGCLQDNATSSQSINITQPKSITATAEGSIVTCNNPADGKVVSKISDGPGSYNYYLKIGNTIASQTENTAIVNWNVSNRAAGNYTVEIRDALRTQCPGFITPVIITPPPVMNLVATNLTTVNVTCNSGEDGKLTLIGVDLTNKYNYLLTSLSSNATLTTSTTPVFNNLKGGTYTLAMKRNIVGCADLYNYPTAIQVIQPSPITIGINRTHISCYGLTNGSIVATPSNGNGAPYTYAWEQRIGSTWSGLRSSSSITNKAAGFYKVRVFDTKSCSTVSEEIEIIEPALLSISSVKLNDIKCFGEKGSIEIESLGGTGTRTNQYSLAGSPLSTFTSATPLSAGVYNVRVKDGRECITPYANSLTITTPANPLTYSFEKSDFNGVNISCFNGANGYVSLSPVGGNGGAYNGYTYGLDTRSYQTDNKIEGINAGNHTVYVKDGRGCIKSQTLNFTQSSQRLTLNLNNKKDVTCYGDTNGALTVTGLGGLAPYTYVIDNVLEQKTGFFTNLNAGIHAVQLIDKNKCADTYSFELLSVNPVIEIHPSVQDVKCFGGQDGKINLSLAGGVPPFTYSWQDQPSLTQELSNIKSGSYSVAVTDKANCKMEKSVTVNQPFAPLRVSLKTTPVCYGLTNGSINITPTGGTLPYLYSVDDGNTYQQTAAFNTVGVGNYNIQVKDNNQCQATASTVIVQRNDRPKPDFIVSSKESALDTLVITEISVPKPDSIYWQFDEHAVVLDNNALHPKIKFTEPGSYSIGMRGYFSGCEYTLTRTLSINPFDPQAAKTKLPSYKGINSVDVSPNPTSGEFTVKVKLNYKHKLSLIIYDVIGNTHYDKAWDSVEELTETVNLGSTIASGVYVLRIITPVDAKDVRIIVNK